MLLLLASGDFSPNPGPCLISTYSRPRLPNSAYTVLFLASTPPISYPSPATLPPLSLSPVTFGMLAPSLTSSSLCMTSFSLTLCSSLL
ncbi:hypothetical protein FKM82_024598 [Ascaphus truei]